MKNKHTRPSQSKKILAYLKSGKRLTPLQALNRFGCFRLAARIHELKAKGHRIVQKTATSKGKTFSSYQLA